MILKTPTKVCSSCLRGFRSWGIIDNTSFLLRYTPTRGTSSRALIEILLLARSAWVSVTVKIAQRTPAPHPRYHSHRFGHMYTLPSQDLRSKDQIACDTLRCHALTVLLTKLDSAAAPGPLYHLVPPRMEDLHPFTPTRPILFSPIPIAFSPIRGLRHSCFIGMESIIELPAEVVNRIAKLLLPLDAGGRYYSQNLASIFGLKI